LVQYILKVINSLTDGDPFTRWKAAKGEKSATIEIDLGASYSIESLALVEPWFPWSNMKQMHELQALLRSNLLDNPVPLTRHFRFSLTMKPSDYQSI
jgi:hypothetical protein